MENFPKPSIKKFYRTSKEFRTMATPVRATRRSPDLLLIFMVVFLVLNAIQLLFYRNSGLAGLEDFSFFPATGMIFCMLSIVISLSIRKREDK